MSNMSYCRWNNTEMDVADCFNAFYDGEGISNEEVIKAKQMLNNMCEFLYDNNVIMNYDLESIFAELDARNEDEW